MPEPRGVQRIRFWLYEAETKWVSGTKTGTANATVDKLIFDAALGYWDLLTKIKIDTDANVQEATVLVDGLGKDETIGPSASQTIDYTKYFYGIVMKSKIEVRIKSGATPGVVTYKVYFLRLPI